VAKNTLSAYLMLGGHCDEAIEFYGEAVSAKPLMVMRFKESPDQLPELPDGFEDKVMHATLEVGDSLLLMSDGCESQENPEIKGMSLSFAADSVEAGKKVFEALAQGGKITMPFAKTFWTPGFGMVVDKFGVGWMVNVEHEGYEG